MLNMSVLVKLSCSSLGKSGVRVYTRLTRSTMHTAVPGASTSARIGYTGGQSRAFSVDSNDQRKAAATASKATPLSSPARGSAKASTTSAPNTTKSADLASDDDVGPKKTEADTREQLERAKNKALLTQWELGPAQYFGSELSVKAEKLGWGTVLKPHLDAYFKLLQQGILSPEASQLDTIRVFILLQNPILAKYKFDVADFASGSEAALQSIRAALCSQSVYNYANNIPETVAAAAADRAASAKGNAAEAAAGSSSAPAAAAARTVDASSADFLKDVIYPSLYHQVIDAVRELNTKGIGFSELPLDVEIHSASVTDLDVRIISLQEHADIKEDNALFAKCATEEQEMLVKHEEMLVEYEKMRLAVSEGGGGSADTVTESIHHEMLHKLNAEPSADADKEAGEEGDSSADAVADADPLKGLPVPSIFNRHFCNSRGDLLQMPLFPVGSVVVDVKVRFNFTPVASAEQCRKATREERDSNEWTEFARGRPTVMEWIISGCISGHVPLEFKVTSFHAGHN